MCLKVSLSSMSFARPAWLEVGGIFISALLNHLHQEQSSSYEITTITPATIDCDTECNFDLVRDMQVYGLFCAGLIKVGDIFEKIEKVPLAGLSLDEVHGMLKGPPQSTVRIK